MILSSVVVILVTSVFLVQNQFYADTVARASLHENVRGATSFITGQLKTVASGGVVVAEADSVVFRFPLVVGGVCDTVSTQTYLMFPMDGEGVDGTQVDGYGTRDPSDGEWTFTDATWGSIFNSSGSGPAGYCGAEGADTVGATADFFRLDGLSASPALGHGDVVMLYQERVFKLAVSTLDPSSFGVYYGPNGGTLMELATGLSETSAFQYLRAGRSSYDDRVTGVSGLAAIEVIRLSAVGIAPPANPARDSLNFELAITVPLKNAG
jgi:hypothetical protein